ncbi:hypothetical protein ACKLNO_09265 [Neisseriaceae bacterium B1]
MGWVLVNISKLLVNDSLKIDKNSMRRTLYLLTTVMACSQTEFDTRQEACCNLGKVKISGCLKDKMSIKEPAFSVKLSYTFTPIKTTQTVNSNKNSTT